MTIPPHTFKVTAQVVSCCVYDNTLTLQTQKVSAQVVSWCAYGPHKLCSTCMVTFHTCLTVGLIRSFISSYQIARVVGVGAVGSAVAFNTGRRSAVRMPAGDTIERTMNYNWPKDQFVPASQMQTEIKLVTPIGSWPMGYCGRLLTARTQG